MGNERVEGYAEGFKVGWNECKKRWIDKFKEFSCIKDDQWYKDWLLEVEDADHENTGAKE